MTRYPTSDIAQRRHHHPAARLRRLPGAARRRPQEVVEQALEVGYRHIDTAQMYRNEAGRRPRDRGVRHPARRALRHHQAQQRLPPARRRAPRVRRRRWTELGLDQVDLFLIHWPLPTRYDGDFVVHLADADRVRRSDGRATLDRRLQLRARPPATDHRRDRRRPGREPDRGAPVLRQRGACAPPTRSTASRPRPGRRSPRARCSTTRPSARSPSGWAVRRPRSTLRWHVQRGDIVFPKSMQPERMRGELRDLRLRARPTTTWPRSPRSTRARPGAPARTRTDGLDPGSPDTDAWPAGMHRAATADGSSGDA